MQIKVQKFGVPLIMGLIPALIFTIKGGYFFVLPVTALAAGIIAELCRKSLGYNTSKGNLISYAVFLLDMTGNLFPI